jgi:DNA repair ATPase RecN
MRIFTQELLESIQGPDGQVDGAREEKYENLEKIFRRGAEDLIDQEKQDKWVREPSERLKEANLNFESIVEKMDEYLTEPSFNRGKFEIELKKLERTLKKLKDKFETK